MWGPDATIHMAPAERRVTESGSTGAGCDLPYLLAWLGIVRSPGVGLDFGECGNLSLGAGPRLRRRRSAGAGVLTIGVLLFSASSPVARLRFASAPTGHGLLRGACEKASLIADAGRP